MDAQLAETLAEALTRIPKKGATRRPYQSLSHTKTQRSKAGWFVHENLHEWAQEQGYLTGCIYKQTERTSSRTRTRTRYSLFLCGPCPYTPGEIRYYTTSLKLG
jgi:hypothetical protein